MRALLTLLLLAAVVIVILILTDVINISQTEEASLPEVQVEEGRMPEFDVDTADVDLGTERRTVEVEVPRVDVRGADEADADDVPDTAR